MKMDLEPEMPEGVTVTCGTKLYRVKGIATQPMLEIVWLPRAPEALLRLRSVIDRLLYESEVRSQTSEVSEGSNTLSVDSSQRSIGKRLADVAKTSATVLLIAIALTTLHFAGRGARAQSLGSYRQVIELAGKINAAMHTRPRSELAKPCHVGDRIKVDGVWYDCIARRQDQPALPEAYSQCPQGCSCKQAGYNADGRPIEYVQRDGTRSVAVVISGPCTNVLVAKNAPLLTRGFPAAAPMLRTRADRLYRSRLIEAMNQPANFMRRWVLSYWGCGTDCLMGAAVNKDTGRVVWLPFYVTEWATADATNVSEPLRFSKRNGTLFIPRGVLVYDHGTGFAPQTWRLFRGKFIRKRLGRNG
jgi:hypothetical protein